MDLKLVDKMKPLFEDIFTPASQADIEKRKAAAEEIKRKEQEEAHRRWEEQRRKEQEEVMANLVRLENIATKLGFTFKRDEERYHRAWLRGEREDGLKLHLDANGYHTKGKVGAGVSFPEGIDGGCPLDSKDRPQDIKISLTKSDDQIVKDIQRRLLPQAEIALKTCKAKIEKQKEAKQSRTSMIEVASKILEIPYDQPRDASGNLRITSYQGDESNVGSLSVETNYYGNEAKIELNWVKKEALETILKAIKSVM